MLNIRGEGFIGALMIRMAPGFGAERPQGITLNPEPQIPHPTPDGLQGNTQHPELINRKT